MTARTPGRLLEVMREVHRFETSGGELRDFKAVVVEFRSLLARAQGEILARAFRAEKLEASQVFLPVVGILQKASEACDIIASMIEFAPNTDARTLATFLVMLGKISTVEAFYAALDLSGPGTAFGAGSGQS